MAQHGEPDHGEPVPTDQRSPIAQQSVAARFSSVRGRTEALAEPLSPEDQTVQSMPDASPTKWHRAHTSWFFETFLLEPELRGYRRCDPSYGYLFNSYYESVGSRHPRPERGVLSRPGAGEIGSYRCHVDSAMLQLLSKEVRPEVADLVQLGMVHEEQHQELILMDIKHLLSRNPTDPAYRSSPPAPLGAPAKPEWSEHDGGEWEIGAEGPGFAFDNERPRHPVHLGPFALADRSVTCGEWLEFIDDGGYHRPELWLSDGWALANREAWEAPMYWWRPDGAAATPMQADGPWQVFTLFGSRDVREAEPVCHVSLYEADAFARWAGARLPTEAEWEVATTRSARLGAPDCPGPVADGWCTDRGPVVADEALHPSTSTGSVWEWTSSAYTPYPGFHPAPGAVGEYNGKFMVNQYVLRGGCCATPPGHVRTTYRNFFPAGARWMFGGLRLARDL